MQELGFAWGDNRGQARHRVAKEASLTQDQNRSFLNPPKEKDGTLRQDKLVPEANWFGPAQAPQEEFTENSPPPADPKKLAEERSEMSEGEPTFSKESLERPDK